MHQTFPMWTVLSTVISSFICRQGCLSQITEAQTVEVAVQVKKILNSGCMFIILPNKTSENLNSLQFMSHKYVKMYWKFDVQVNTLPASSLLSNGNRYQCQQNKPLFVFSFNMLDTYDYIREISEYEHLSDAFWLIFLQSEIELRDFLIDVNIPLNCEFLIAQPEDDHIVLTEVYRVSPTSPLQIYRLGAWSAEKIVMISDNGFYRRRANLHKFMIKTGTINDILIRIIKEDNNKPFQIGGYYGEIWHTVERILNFSSDYSKPLDDAYGSLQLNNTWNGMIDMVLKNQVHICNADFFWTDLRMQAVDFIYPTSRFKVRMFVKMPEEHELPWNNFLMPFSFEIWLCICATIPVIALFLSITEKYRSYFEHRPVTLMPFEVLFYIIGVFSNHGYSFTTGILSGRIIVLTSYLTAFTLISSYSGSFLSYLMVPSFKPPFKNFEEFVRDGSYALGVQANSAELDYFKNSQNQLMREIYNKAIQPYITTSPHHIFEGLMEVCSRRKYAWMTEVIDALLYSSTLNCKLFPIPEAFIPAYGSMAIKKKSPFKEVIKITLTHMHQTGLLQALYERNTPPKIYDTPDSYKRIEMNDVIPVFMVLTSGVIGAVLILMLEKIIVTKCSKRY